MGYRSDVALIIHFASVNEPEKAHADYIRFQHWVKHDLVVEVEDHSTPHTGVVKPFTYQDYVDLWLGSNSTMSDQERMGWAPQDHQFIFNLFDVKWYPSYPETKVIEAMMNKAQEFSTCAYRYVCIGEETDDLTVSNHEGPEYSDENHVSWQLEVQRTFSFHGTPETLTKEISV